MRVGFVGLGDQGAPMARAVAEAGWPLHVWARRPQSLDALDGVASVACDTVDELARNCDLVLLCVRSDDDVEQLLVDQGLLAGLAPGSVVANHGTGSPQVAAALEQRAGEAGVVVLDAPVSGGGEGARNKTLTVMVGGDHGAYERCKPVFESFGRLVVHLGPAGSGQLAKLVNNTVFAANLKNAGDMLRVAEGLGLDLDRMAELVLASSGGSFALEALYRHMTPELVEHYQAMVAKDVGHFADVARTRQVATAPLEDAARHGVEAMAEAVRRLQGLTSDRG